MSIPAVYYGNLLASGLLSGSNASTDNPVRRVADGSVTLPYEVVSAAVDSALSGVVQVTLTIAAAPDALVMARGSVVSGHRFILESEDVGGGNNATVLDFTISGAASTVRRDIVGATARRVWRLTVSAASGLAGVDAHELMLADKMTFPRSPEVGVARDRVRQFTRIEVPGGQPFVQRTGPMLRRRAFSLQVASGSELSGFEAFTGAVNNGQMVYLLDDLAEEFPAELIDQVVPFPDEAGLYGMRLGFQEIAVD